MYNSKNLYVVAYANGFTLWAYKTKDTIEKVMADNYFFSAKKFMKDNDVLYVLTPDGVYHLYVKYCSQDLVTTDKVK